MFAVCLNVAERTVLKQIYILKQLNVLSNLLFISNFVVYKTDEHLKKRQFLLLVHSKFENPFEIR